MRRLNIPSELAKYMVRSALLLAVFAMLGGGLVALTFDTTKERIAANERALLLRNLHNLVPPQTYDNDIATDVVEVQSKDLLGTDEPVTVYRARQSGAPVAAVMSPYAPQGYNGPIHLLVAIAYNGTLIGVRTLSHHETPGLGDAIELEKSPWILSFSGKSLAYPKPAKWTVKRDGGEFDQFTGATITPRAVVKAVYNTLVFFQEHKDELFATDTPAYKEGNQHDH